MGQPAQRYRGRLIAIGTKHGKQDQFGPAFRAVLQARVVVPEDLDTDQFGTFAGEIDRSGSALDSARAKARLAMATTGLTLGLASEASYGPLPGSGLVGHEEIALFCDEDLGIEVLEGYRSTSVPGTAHCIGRDDEIPRTLVAGLPTQALIARSAACPPGALPVVYKGLSDVRALRAAIADAAAGSVDGRAIVEPDLRAHHNPSRREVLARLALTLAHRLATQCPRCDTPGFGRVGTEPGLPCRICRTPTPGARGETHGCCRCEHTISVPLATEGADPAGCPECNP